MLYLIGLASISFVGIVVMVSTRLWQIKSGKVETNGDGASFWAKAYEAILIGESKVINFLAGVLAFCFKVLSKLDLKPKFNFLMDKLFGKLQGKISDIRKTIKGEMELPETKEKTSEFLKDVSGHKNGKTADDSIEK